MGFIRRFGRTARLTFVDVLRKRLTPHFSEVELTVWDRSNRFNGLFSPPCPPAALEIGKTYRLEAHRTNRETVETVSPLLSLRTPN